MTVTASGGPRVLGLDSAGDHGWLGVVVDDSGFLTARLGRAGELVEWAEPIAAIGIDIPIGHGPDHRRPADVAARRFLTGRASSVFPTPRDEVLESDSYEAANELLVALGVPKLSRQGWALVPKMREAAALAATDDRVHEVHPEVSFQAMSDDPLPWSKKSWNGLMLRRRLLAEAGIDLPDALPELNGATADDFVDAAAAAWSARRIAAGSARSLPNPPAEHGGRSIAIWF